MRELVFSLQQMYEQLAQGINGDIRGDEFQGRENWTPVLKDTADATTTFTYDYQDGWVLRRGLMVDCFFDVKWTANTGAIAGNMYVELPYKVAITDQMPFVGVCQPSIFSFTAGTTCVVNAITNSYRAEIWNTGNGFTTANQGSVAAGRLISHIRYLGNADERA